MAGSAPKYGDEVWPSFLQELFFRSTPEVGGMANFDSGTVSANPYSSLPARSQDSVMENERARLLMRDFGRPKFKLTPEQKAAFAEYSPRPKDRKDTVMARIVSGDPSSGKPSERQESVADQLRPFLTALFGGGSK